MSSLPMTGWVQRVCLVDTNGQPVPPPSSSVLPLPVTVTADPVTGALTMTAQPGAAIHYTLDGSTPNLLSPLYTGPVAVPPGVPTNYAAIAFAAPVYGSPATVGSVTAPDPDVLSWVARASAAGGAPTQAEQTAYGKALVSMRACGLRAKITRFNWFGGGFAGGFIPLIADAGPANDTNHGLDATMYSPAVGFSPNYPGYLEIAPPAAVGQSVAAGISAGVYAMGIAGNVPNEGILNAYDAGRANEITLRTSIFNIQKAFVALGANAQTAPVNDPPGLGDTRGLHLGSLLPGDGARLYFRGLAATGPAAPTAATLPTANYRLWRSNDGNNYIGTPLSGYLHGTGMDSSDASNLAQILAQLQTDLGRPAY